MQFPIKSAIAPVSYGKLSAVTLQIDGNAGQIPPSFQWALFDAEGVLCAQGVCAMTADQWNSWTTQTSAEYILASTAANLGLSLTP